MKISRRTHVEISIQNLIFTLLFLGAVGLVAWLSTQYKTQFDWTATHRHTLSEASRKVVDLLQEPVSINVYARENTQVRDPVRDLIARYQHYKPSFNLSFTNPDTQPDKVREMGIQVEGEMVLTYQGRSEKIQEPTEVGMTNALQRLVTSQTRRILFLSGHGDRSPEGRAGHDYQQFADELKRKGFKLAIVSLPQTPVIPSDTSVLVIAGPKGQFLPGEIKLIEGYLKRGGNLWWLADPGDLRGLAPIANFIGVSFLPGTVVDAATQLLGINDPTFALVADYPPHPITRGFEQMTMLPTAAALTVQERADFDQDPLLSTLQRSWTELGPIQGKVELDVGQGERQGPLNLAYAITRKIGPEHGESTATNPKAGEEKNTLEPQGSEQRIVVVGDGDFLSNQYLGNGGNLELGINMVQWLSGSDSLINIPTTTMPDRILQLSPAASGWIAIVFLILLPMALFGAGGWIWFKRRRA